MIRNTVTGILGIDPKLIEAANAMGMTPSQRLQMVELPLAMPVILTGIRVAVVISVGVATVAAAVGAGGLGTYIFRGLRQNDNNLLLAGLASALLALLCRSSHWGRFERAYAIGERAASSRRRITGAAVLDSSLSSPWSVCCRISDLRFRIKNVARYGTKDSRRFKRFYRVRHPRRDPRPMLEKARHRGGSDKLELGGNLSHDRLLSKQIDVYPEYTGTAYTAILKHTPITDPQAVYDQTKNGVCDKFDLS